MEKEMNYHIPRFHEFPDIELYMDQVVTYLNKQLLVFSNHNKQLLVSSKDEAELVTSSMINNYVKNGIIPPPNGKKYTRRHLAYMTAVFFLKQTLKMEELKQIIDFHINSSNEQIAYETFCTQLEDAFFSMLPKGDLTELSAEEAGSLSLKYAAVGIAGKLYAQKTAIILEAHAGNQNNDRAEKKESKPKTEKKESKAEKKNEK